MSVEILDPTFDVSAWQRARPRRLLLAAYIDFLIFSIPWAFLVFATQQTFPAIAGLPWPVKFMVFGLVEVLLLRLHTWSPGTHVLGIRFAPVRNNTSPINRLWQRSIPYVSNELRSRESWFTLVLAVWILNEGCKGLIRWTMWNPPIPFFGQPTGEATSAFIYLVSGGLELYIAFQLFRVHVRAAFVGVPYNITQLVSAVLSWNLWDEWVREMIIRRRDFQGLPIRDGEVERMQALTPELLVGSIGLSIVLLLVAVPRLRSRTAQGTVEPNVG